MNKLKMVFLVITVAILACNTDGGKKKIHETIGIDILDSLLTRFEHGDTLGSLIGMQQYVTDYPNDDPGLTFLGTLYLALNKDSLALENVQRALEINPNNYGALTNYGILLDRQSKHNEAFIVYKRVLVIKNDYAQAYSNLMGNRIDVGDLDNARIYGEQALRYGNNISDKGVLCAIYHKLGFYRKRDSLYTELIKSNYSNIEQLEELIR
jgi:tetratricopeptide (TPR) repeat protein